MVNKAELRQFIVQYFSDIELDEFCFDYFPDLLNEFTAGMTKSQKTIALIGYCERRGRLDHLLTALAQLRPQAFARQFGLVPSLEKSDADEQRNPNQVFLSHANQDAAFAQQLAGDLRRAGMDVWIAPDSIRPGEKWVDAINRGLETSGNFVLVMTSRAAASKWVRDESSYAIALENKDVMRFITLDVDGGQVPPLWSVRQHISFREDYDEGLQQLLAELLPGQTALPATTERPDPAIERFLVRNAAESAERSTGGAVTRQTSAAIGQREPAALKQLATTLPGKPLHWAVGVVVLLAVMLVGWQLMGAGSGGDGSPVAEVTPAAGSGNSGGAVTDQTRTPTPSQTADGDGSGTPVAIITPAAGSVDTGAAVPDPSRTPTQTLAPTQTPTLTRTPAPTRTPRPTSTPSHTVEVRAVLRGDMEVEQVFVPAGSFMMGSEDGYYNESPVHEVTLDAFWIDRTEVTNAQFAACVADGTCQPPADSSSATRDSYYDNAQFADYPVIYVSWTDAHDFCTWAGGRLPTEAEWEYAARGPESPTYPWGDDEPSSSLLNYDENTGDTTEAGSYPAGASWVGALDMAGNVWEWVIDWHDSEYYGRSPGENPSGPASGQYRVLRGGAWNNLDNSVRSAVRLNFVLPDDVIVSIGFRCAQE